MPIKVTVDKIGLNKKIKTLSDKRLTIGLHNTLIDIWDAGVRAFIRAALKEIIVDTGMSAASLIPLGRLVKSAEINLITPRRGPQIGYTQLGGSYVRNGIRGPKTGERFGKEAFTLTYGDPEKPVFYFSFKAVVFQHFLMDLGLGNFNRPVQSIEKGLATMRTYIGSGPNSRWAIVADDVIQTWIKTSRLIVIT